MKELIDYLINGDNIASFLLAISMLAAGIVLIEKLYTWVSSKLKKYYDFKHGKETEKENEKKQDERLNELDTKLDTIENKLDNIVNTVETYMKGQKNVNTVVLRNIIHPIYEEARRNQYILEKDKQDFKYAYDEYVRNGGNSYVIDEVEPFIHNLKVYMTKEDAIKDLKGEKK